VPIEGIAVAPLLYDMTYVQTLSFQDMPPHLRSGAADISKAPCLSDKQIRTVQNFEELNLTGSALRCLIGRMDQVETEAIRQVLAGDRDAYRVLMDRHFRSVFRVAFRITGNESDAEEASQEAFLRAYNKLSTFRRDSSFSTWITRITMNTSLNLVERRNRDHARMAPRVAGISSIADQTLQVADGAAGPDRVFFDTEAAALRCAAMATLTPLERAAFTLRHMEDFATAEIATALNIPGSSVKQAVFRAVGKLRRSLATLEGGLR